MTPNPGKANLLKSSTSGIFLGLVTLLIFIFYYLPPPGFRPRYISPYGWGGVALVTLFFLTWIFTSNINPFKMVVGADGRPSTSKFKPFLWTIAIIFSYVVIYAARIEKGYFEEISDIPINVLIALGFDAATLIGAKAITESQIASGQTQKPPTSEPSANTKNLTTSTTTNTTSTTANTSGPGAIVNDDKGFPDLSKMQTVAWTLLAIVVYLVCVDNTLDSIQSLSQKGLGTPPFPTERIPFPDIGATLMVLTGLGDAAYLGKKLVTTQTPIINRMLPDRGSKDTVVTITGVSFGATQNGSRITIDDADVANPGDLVWNNNQIKFKLPDKHPNGTDWVAGKKILIGLTINGQVSNKLEFTVVPTIKKLSPATGSAGTLVTISGESFGANQGNNRITIDNTEVTGPVTDWKDSEIKFNLPAMHPNGTSWTNGQKISIGLTVNGQSSNKQEFTT